MTRRTLLWSYLTAITAGSVILPGCSAILRQAVIGGTYTYITGGLSQSLTSGDLQNSLQSLLSGLLFPGASQTNAGT